MKNDFWNRFFKDSDHTGRFMIVSNRTGVKYFVEPIEGRNRPASWGDLDTTIGTVTGNYGQKYKGSIKPEESLITPENGFKDVVTLEIGSSPEGYIDWKDSQYPTKTR